MTTRRQRSAGNLLPVPWIEPEDVASAVVLLASDRARYVTGSEFVLDAGLLARQVAWPRRAKKGRRPDSRACGGQDGA